MKYSEYQVWFHSFNNAVLGFSRHENIFSSEVIKKSNDIANFCVDKFKDVEAPEIPNIGAGIDLKEIIDQVSKEPNKKRKY